MDIDLFEKKKKEQYGAGFTIILLLAVLTLGEFGIAAVGTKLAGILIIISIIKAGLVMRDYMHIGRLFSEEEAR